MSQSYEPRSGDDDPGHHGGAWKVAYADFVTALMALFIVLWLLNSTREVREAVSGYFRNPLGRQEGSGSGQAGSGENLSVDRNNVAQLRQKLDGAMHSIAGFEQISKYVAFTVTGEGLRIELMEQDTGMFFDTGSPHPTPAGEALFGVLAQQLGTLPNTVAIEGHTDARPFHSQHPEAYGNWELSFDRANMARRIMLAHGLGAVQVSEIRGYADRQPLPSADPNSSSNRRVSVIVKYPNP